VAAEKEAEVGMTALTWWTDRSRTDDGRVGAVAVSKHGTGWRAFYGLGTGEMEVFDAGLWAIGIALRETIRRRGTLHTHAITTIGNML
jgi:hypothetical protein